MRTIWLDLTTNCRWNRPPVGVVRTEAEMARYFFTCGDKHVRFCYYENMRHQYYELARSFVVELLGQRDRLALRTDTAANALAQCSMPLVFGEGDVYVTLGLDWDQKDYPYIYGLKKKNKFKVVTFCYDVIPVLYPHYCVGAVAGRFGKYFVDLAWLSDHVFCISKCTERDVLRFLQAVAAPLPSTDVVTLGCDIVTDGQVASLSDRLKKVIDRKYILFVSTIERRKNHETIYKAIVKLVESGREPPHVVFVGMQGWGVSELMQDLRLDPRVRGRFTILSQLSDQELTMLYKNSLFTVFPSHYEGWGLPVAESLAYGKFCLTSASSSLPEVGGELLEYIDPHDVTKWAERIQHYYETPHILAEKEERIKKFYERPSWMTAAQKVHAAVAALLDKGGKPPCPATNATLV